MKLNYILIVSPGRGNKVYHTERTYSRDWHTTDCGLDAFLDGYDLATFGTPPSNLRLCGNCARVRS
jgi:hypothetical protein